MAASLKLWLEQHARVSANLWPASRINELMPWAWATGHSGKKVAA